MDGCMDGWMDGKMDGGMDVGMDGEEGGRRDGWLCRRKEGRTVACRDAGWKGGRGKETWADSGTDEGRKDGWGGGK